MIIFLIGFMGCGKSRLGRKLAARTGFRLIDTDKEIENAEGKTVRQIFERKGEEYFRQKEKEFIQSLGKQKNLIVATGGGLPCFGDNMQIINRKGISFFLNASEQALFDRLVLKKYKRPLIASKTDQEIKDFIHEKLMERKPYYLKARHIIPSDEIGVEAILERLGME